MVVLGLLVELLWFTLTLSVERGDFVLVLLMPAAPMETFNAAFLVVEAETDFCGAAVLEGAACFTLTDTDGAALFATGFCLIQSPFLLTDNS